MIFISSLGKGRILAVSASLLRRGKGKGRQGCLHLHINSRHTGSAGEQSIPEGSHRMPSRPCTCSWWAWPWWVRHLPPSGWGRSGWIARTCRAQAHRSKGYPHGSWWQGYNLQIEKKEPGLASINSWQNYYIMFINETNHLYIWPHTILSCTYSTYYYQSGLG